MLYRNPVFNRYGTVDVEIDHPQFGWIPFTASPNDPELLGREIYAAIDLSTVSPYVPPIVVPATVVAKSIVMKRLIDAGMMTQAYQGLTSNPIYFARWFAPDRPEVDCSDPDAVAFVKALGLDPAVILAP